MSEWNLSVRLTGQGSDLAASLRDSAKEAGKLKNRINDVRQALAELRAAAANNINVRLDIDAGHLRSDVQAAIASAGSGQSLGIRLDIDADHLRSDVSAALASAGSGQALGIRLGIDADHLRADVQAAVTAAGTGQGLGIRLDVDADHLRSDVDAALASAGAGQGLRVRLDVDADHLRTEVQTAITAAAGGQSVTVGITVDDTGLAALRANSQDTAHSLNVLQRAAREAKNELEELEARALTTSAALRRINTAAGRSQGRLNDLSGSTRTFRTDLDDLDGSLTRVGGRLGDLRGRVGGLTASNNQAANSTGSLVPLFIALATAAVPLTSVLVPLAGDLAAGGVSAVAFGAALAGQIGPLGEVADAEKKYQDAVRANGKTSAEAIKAQVAYQQVLADMPPATQRAAIALSTLKNDFGDWSDDMSSFTMTPLTNGITVLDQIIPRLSPHVESMSTQLERVVSVAGGEVSTPGFDAMADKFADFSDRQLEEMTDHVIHFLRVLSEGGAVKSGPVAEFLAYAKENGPEARAALRAISEALITLLQAASQAGPSMLTLVTAAASLVAALPPELVAVILQVAAALKILQLSNKGLSALSGALDTVRAQVARLAATSAAAGGGIAGLRAALASLSTGAKLGITAAAIGALVLTLHELSDNKPAVEVDALSTSLNTLISTGKVTGTLKTNFDEMSASIATVSKGASDNKLAQWTSDFGTWIGIATGPGISTSKKNIDAWDQSMANLVKAGRPKEAAAQFELLKRAWKAGGGDMEEFREATTGYQGALADASFEQEMAAESMGLFGKAALDTQSKLDAQKASADGLRQSIQALNDVNRAAGSAMSAFEQSIDDATKATKDHSGALKIRDGDLDLGSEKSREAEKALSDLAADTDAAATAAREQGRSWEYVQGIMTRGQDAFVQTAVKMGLTKKQAEALSQSYLDIPDSKTTVLDMQAEDATRDLQAFNAAVQASPDARSVTLKTLSAGAEKILEAFGYKVTHLKNGSVKVSAKTGQALAGVSDVASAVAALRDKSITITTNKVTKFSTVGVPGSSVSAAHRDYADGGIADYYANGGVRHFAGGAENHVAQIAPGGSWRIWGEPETQGEGYVPFAPSKRVRSRAITEEIVRRLGGDPQAIQWNAAGNVTDWRYDPSTGSLYSASDAGSAGHKTKKVKVKGKVKEIEYFDIGAVEKKLLSASKATTVWNKNLEKVADRVGGDVAESLAAMGEDGAKLAAKMANGSTAYINKMAAALRNLQKTAKASLTDYTRQLTSANKLNKTFSDNLAKLAGMGYGDLASQLAEQNDEAAQQLAAAAVKDKKKAATANTAAKSANTALTADQVSELVQIIAAITTKTTGIHTVAGTTGLGEDEIIDVANKAKAQISSSLGSRATRFLADLGKANKHLAYADGGLRAGIYATGNGIVRFAEPETHGEAYVPLSPSKRRTAMPVLADVAHRFGVGLTDAGASRPVVIVQGGGDTNVSVTAVRTGATATDIGAQVGRSVRRARRGGVAARAA